MYNIPFPQYKPKKPGTFRVKGDLPAVTNIMYMAYWSEAGLWTDQHGTPLPEGHIVREFYDMSDIINKVNNAKRNKENTQANAGS